MYSVYGHTINKKHIKHATHTFTMATALGAGLYQGGVNDIKLDETYDRVVGIAAYVRTGSTGGGIAYNIGLTQNGTTVHDQAPSANWTSRSGVKIEDDFKPIVLYPKDGNVKITIETLETTSDDLTIDFVFLYVRD